TDFGLAKREAGELTWTTEGVFLGTPAYASPEQASGKPHQADRRSDIYSLGVILYEMLTGERPFRGTPNEVLTRIQRDAPPRTRSWNRTAPRDLETICLKCLEKQPKRRYRAAGELADDLDRVLTGIPISAQRIGTFTRFWQWYSRSGDAPRIMAGG